MSSQKKRVRILTNRDFPNPLDFEFIEKDDSGQFFWRAGDMMFLQGEEIIRTEACFPVDKEFVKEKFKELGREFKDE